MQTSFDHVSLSLKFREDCLSDEEKDKETAKLIFKAIKDSCKDDFENNNLFYSIWDLEGLVLIKSYIFSNISDYLKKETQHNKAIYSHKNPWREDVFFDLIMDLLKDDIKKELEDLSYSGDYDSVWDYFNTTPQGYFFNNLTATCYDQPNYNKDVFKLFLYVKRYFLGGHFKFDEKLVPFFLATEPDILMEHFKTPFEALSIDFGNVHTGLFTKYEGNEYELVGAYILNTDDIFSILLLYFNEDLFTAEYIERLTIPERPKQKLNDVLESALTDLPLFVLPKRLSKYLIII